MSKTKVEPQMVATAAWQAVQDQVVALLRPAYLAELERLALSLRPRFESGELRGFTDEDAEREVREKGWQAPAWKLEEACARWFGLDERGQERDLDAACRAADLIRQVAPGDAYTEADQPPLGQAVIAIACDVVAIARARNWYKPTADECPAEEFTKWATEAA